MPDSLYLQDTQAQGKYEGGLGSSVDLKLQDHGDREHHKNYIRGDIDRCGTLAGIYFIAASSAVIV